MLSRLLDNIVDKAKGSVAVKEIEDLGHQFDFVDGGRQAYGMASKLFDDKSTDKIRHIVTGFIFKFIKGMYAEEPEEARKEAKKFFHL